MLVQNQLKHQVTLPVDRHSLFRWFSREGAFYRLMPPWEQVTLISRDPGLEAGNRTVFIMKVGLIRFTWIAEHVDYEAEESFTDMQIQGPFRYWRHHHRFRILDESSSIMEDTVRYALPGGPLAQFFLRRSLKKQIKTMFRYRARVLFNDFTCQNRYPTQPMKILIAGGTGFIGTELTAFLKTCGHTVSLLTRTPRNEHEFAWDPEKETIDAAALDGCDVVINLAGENIGGKRWTARQKKQLRSSRLQTTKTLVNAINASSTPPKTFLCASAIGFFGTEVHTPQTEQAPPGTSFLASLCHEWESEAQRACCRTVNMRFGLVLSPKGGALAKMLPPFRWGLGGTLGTGKQLVSWITMDDLLYQLYHILCTDSIEGPVNMVTADTVTNEVFTKALGKALKRPTICSVPERILTTGLGDMAKETLLASTAAHPEKLLETGTTFAYPTLKKALDHILPR